MKKHNYQTDWEEFVDIDKKWSILTKPEKKYNKWEEEEFFQTGKHEIGRFLKLIKDKNLEIKYGNALDFGCGLGRVTQALGRHFDKVYGVDVSEKMITEAKKLHYKNRNLIFFHNTKNDLRIFGDNKLDLIFSIITLQHIPDKGSIKNFIEEFMRILKPGGILYFQLPSTPNYTWLKIKILEFRSFLYYFFTRNLGFRKEFCYKTLKLAPFMHMNYIKSEEIKNIFNKKNVCFLIFNDRSRETAYLIKK